MLKSSILLLVSHQCVAVLLEENDLFYSPVSLSFFPLAQANLHNLIASLDKYPVLVELTCTANMPARQYTDELNPDGQKQIKLEYAFRMLSHCKHINLLYISKF